jgi:hypothetical protein
VLSTPADALGKEQRCSPRYWLRRDPGAGVANELPLMAGRRDGECVEREAAVRRGEGPRRFSGVDAEVPGRYNDIWDWEILVGNGPR